MTWDPRADDVTAEKLRAVGVEPPPLGKVRFTQSEDYGARVLHGTVTVDADGDLSISLDGDDREREVTDALFWDCFEKCWTGKWEQLSGA